MLDVERKSYWLFCFFLLNKQLALSNDVCLRLDSMLCVKLFCLCAAFHHSPLEWTLNTRVEDSYFRLLMSFLGDKPHNWHENSKNQAEGTLFTPSVILFYFL